MSHENKPPINHGVLRGFRDTDFVAGVIPYEVRNPSGNWLPHVPEGEKQHSLAIDNMDCVSEACNNVFEIQIKQQTGEIVNFSDRFLAKMSGTTQAGNWVYIVLDTWRLIGCVLETVWPRPANLAYTWDEYYSAIPMSVLNQAAPTLAKYKIEYERISDISSTSIQHHLKHAPLMLTIPGHEIAGVILSATGDTVTYLDSYNPFIKTINLSSVQVIYKAVLTVRTTMAKVLNDNGTIRIEFGSGPQGFNIGVASSSLFNQIVASGEPILVQPASTPEKLTLSEGMIIHSK